MTAPEFAAARRKLGFATQADLANYLGVSRNAVCRWETGVTPVPSPVWRVMKLLAPQQRKACGECHLAVGERCDICGAS